MIERVRIRWQIHLLIGPLPLQRPNKAMLDGPGRHQMVLALHDDHVGFVRLELHPGSLFGRRRGLLEVGHEVEVLKEGGLEEVVRVDAHYDLQPGVVLFYRS